MIEIHFQSLKSVSWIVGPVALTRITPKGETKVVQNSLVGGFSSQPLITVHGQAFVTEVKVHCTQFSEHLKEFRRVVLELQDPQNHCEQWTVNMVSMVVSSSGQVGWCFNLAWAILPSYLIIQAWRSLEPLVPLLWEIRMCVAKFFVGNIMLNNFYLKHFFI